MNFEGFINSISFACCLSACVLTNPFLIFFFLFLVKSLIDFKKIRDSYEVIIRSDVLEIFSKEIGILEIFYRRKSPVQVMAIPYTLIKEIRPITDDEWKKELGMSNPLRFIIRKPRMSALTRFAKGVGKKDLYVILFNQEVEAHRIKEKLGILGMIFFGGLLHFLAEEDRKIHDEEKQINKVFINIPRDRYSEFNAAIEQSMEKILKERKFYEDMYFNVEKKHDDELMTYEK